MRAIDTVTGRARGPSTLSPPSSAAVSTARISTWRARRSTTYPEGVTRTGLLRTSSTRPVVASRAFRRWLTADGVTCSARAAASSVPAETTASSAQLSQVQVHEQQR